MAISVLFLCVFMFICKSTQAAVSPGVYILGDSLVDVGNNNYLPASIAKANFAHNGIDFPNRIPTGRFCNGQNIADSLVRRIGLPSPPPYLSLFGAMPPSTGVSFASGGGGILNETSVAFVQAISLGQQVDYFNVVRDRVIRQIGPSDAQAYFSKSLFTVVIGANDFFAYFRAGSVASRRYTPQQYVDRMVSSFKGLLKTLYGLGARKLVVTNVPVIGCCPTQRRASRTGECNAEINYWSTKYNDGLKTMLQGLKSESPGLNYAYFEFYGAMVNVLQTPWTYGLMDVKEACCGLGILNADSPCIPIARYCPNRRNHFFWDLIHPTEAAASIFANLIYNGSQQVMVPINVQQLLAL